MVVSSTARERYRRTGALLLVLGLVTGMLGMLAGSASALTGTTFNASDGNQVVNGAEQDWASVTANGAGGTPKWAVNEDDPVTSSSDLSFGGGTNEDDPDTNIVNGSIPPNKSDIRDFYMATQRVTTASTFTDFMYLGWDRVQDPQGTTNFDFELNQATQTIPGGPYDGNGQPWTINRTPGDILVTYDLSNGGTNPTISFLRWTLAGPCDSNAAKAPCWGSRNTLTPNYAVGGINAGTIDNILKTGSEPATLDPRTFGEAAINLSDSGILPRDKCVSFASAFLKSRSSDSFTAEIKDFTPPQPINVSNCGKLTIVKDAQPDAGQAFSFNMSGGSGATTTSTAFNLTDNGTNAALRSKSFLLFPGTYTTTETVPSGWSLTGVACADAAAPNTPIGSAVTNGKSVSIASPSDDITCTFTNQQNASITITKDASPDGSQVFDFTGTGTGVPSTFHLRDSSANDTSRTVTFTNLAPGATYTVGETVPNGWTLSDINCSDGVTTSGTVATFNPGPGEHLSCTFINTQGASLTIVKNAVPDDPQDFSFTKGGEFGSGSFTLDDDDALTSPSVTPDSITFSNLTPGTTYTVSEGTNPTGWDLTGLSCTGGGSATITTPTASVVLNAGGSMTCTYTNTKRGSITVVKRTNPSGADATFSYDASGFPNFDIDTGTSSTHTVSNLAPGNYSVSELAKSGWDFTSLTCDGPAQITTATAAITLAAGEDITCTYVNTQRGTITIVKDAQPNDAQAFGFTTSANLKNPPSFTLVDNGPGATTSTAFTVAPGTYTVSEDVTSGTAWNLTNVACTDGGTSDLAQRRATIVLPAGGSVTCTFTNVKQTPPPPPPPPPPPEPTTTTTQPPTTTTQPPQVLPEVITTTTTTLPPTTTTTIKVLGVQLARTGSNTGIWLQLAGALLVLGGVLMLASDRRVWPVIQRR
jgi:hypothetical protein